jgi:hypothetical protein
MIDIRGANFRQLAPGPCVVLPKTWYLPEKLGARQLGACLATRRPGPHRGVRFGPTSRAAVALGNARGMRGVADKVTAEVAIPDDDDDDESDGDGSEAEEVTRGSRGCRIGMCRAVTRAGEPRTSCPPGSPPKPRALRVRSPDTA